MMTNFDNTIWQNRNVWLTITKIQYDIYTMYNINKGQDFKPWTWKRNFAYGFSINHWMLHNSCLNFCFKFISFLSLSYVSCPLSSLGLPPHPHPIHTAVSQQAKPKLYQLPWPNRHIIITILYTIISINLAYLIWAAILDFIETSLSHSI